MGKPTISICAGLVTLAFGTGVAATADAFSISRIGGYDSGLGAGGTEIVAYDRTSKHLFVTNGVDTSVDILDIHDPSNPFLIKRVDLSTYGAGVNSVSASRGLVAAAVEADVKQDPGSVVFLDAFGTVLRQVGVGALPDMVTFTPRGDKVLVANEGEPNDAYDVDPEGTVSIIDISAGVAGATVQTVDFRDFNAGGPRDWELPAGVRIFGPGASVAQDLEPEYIAVTDDSSTAYVTLQENNAIAVIDIASAYVQRITALGFVDHAVAGHRLDPSDRDGGIHIDNWPAFGMFQPDGIAVYTLGNQSYLVTGNEGDSRDYDGFSEEIRVKDVTLDPSVFPNAADLQQDEALGRLKITSELGDADGDGRYEQLVNYGTRSFSIWNGSNGSLLYDSGEQFENITAGQVPALFNSQGDAGSFDKRSDDKGPEPEGAVVGPVNGRQYAFIGLERVGGVMIYDVSSPTAASFVQYEPAAPGDVAPEGLAFIAAVDSPDHQALLVVANEVSGTISVYSMPAPPILPEPAPAAPVWVLGLASLALAGIGWRLRKPA